MAEQITIEAPTAVEITKKLRKAEVEAKAQKGAAEKPKAIEKAAVPEKKTAKKAEAPKSAKKVAVKAVAK